MSKTYAYSSVIFGVLGAIGVWALTDSVVLAILCLIAVTVVGFIVIRAIEKLIGKGIDKGVDALSNAVAKKREEKNKNNNEQ